MKRSLILVSILFSATAYAADLHTNAVVQPLSAAPQLLIPAAASTAGANGTFFRSDISIINFASQDEVVRLQWIPESGFTGATTSVTIPAHSGIRSADFVTDYLKQSGLGSIVISGINSLGLTDLNAQLYASERIWTPLPGGSGTTGQSLVAVPVSAVNTQIAALFAVGGADNPLNYHVNVGIVNLSSNPQTFQISLPTNLVPPLPNIQVSVAAMSMQQVGVGAGLGPTQQIVIQNVTGGSTQSNSWIAYGSSVDNTTGDAWSEIAVQGVTP